MIVFDSAESEDLFLINIFIAFPKSMNFNKSPSGISSPKITSSFLFLSCFALFFNASKYFLSKILISFFF